MATLEISQESTNSAYPPLAANTQLAQTFLAESAFYLSYVELLMYRQGTPPNINVDIQGVSGGYPDGNVITTLELDISGITLDTAGEWVACVFDPGIQLTLGTSYSVVVRDGWTNASNRYLWKGETTGDPYANGKRCRSTDGGASWGDLQEATFRIYSDEPPSSGGSILLTPLSLGWIW